MEKKIYENPEIEVLRFEVEDVITASTSNPDETPIVRPGN